MNDDGDGDGNIWILLVCLGSTGGLILSVALHKLHPGGCQWKDHKDDHYDLDDDDTTDRDDVNIGDADDGNIGDDIGDNHRFFFQRPNATNPWVNKELEKGCSTIHTTVGRGKGEGGSGLPGQPYYTRRH